MVLTYARRPATIVDILQRCCRCWRDLCYFIDKSIVGDQDQTHVPDKDVRKARAEGIQVRGRRRARKMYCREGAASFYSGLTPALLGVTHLAVQFPLYEQFKRYLTGTELGNWHEGQGWLQILGILTASSASKVVATVATYPHEVVRTRLQTQRKTYSFATVELARPSKNDGLLLHGKGPREGSNLDVGTSRKEFPHLYRGIIGTFARILREEGWRALYSGMGTSLLGAIPASATAMLVYETVLRLLKTKDGRRPSS